ncbi:hypothetical protein [Streptomyces lydicus]|uniref:hypothetical protein n=1 Tax=Streptomyces lydicus TaxID=47763 RepID=UPI0036A5A352
MDTNPIQHLLCPRSLSPTTAPPSALPLPAPPAATPFAAGIAHGHDAIRNLVVGGIYGLPKSVPSDVLAGLPAQVKSAFGRLVIALVAVHARPGHEFRTLLTEDLDLACLPRPTRHCWARPTGECRG